MTARSAVATLVAAVAVTAGAGCGGDDGGASEAAKTPAAATASPLLGEWTDGGAGFVIALNADGTFSIDTDGSLENGSYVWGTYSDKGSKLNFVADAASPCRGHVWDWEYAIGANGTLTAELLNDACQATAGERWSLTQN